MKLKKTILFITYTIAAPIIGGAFMRALRLALEMSRRGWQPIICNNGPMLSDPKVDAAVAYVRFVQLTGNHASMTEKNAAAELSAIDPDVIVMGEGPINSMRVYYDAARCLKRPFIVLDQFYNHWLMPERAGVDLVLLYALAGFWGDDLVLEPPYEITPPFIEDVTHKAALPVPSALHDLPWAALVAYEASVLSRGMNLLSQVNRPDLVKVVISRNPIRCHHEAKERGFDMEKFISLPLQMDPVVFGFLAASSVALVSNGFLQIMDCLALACPVIALERGSGVGMNELNIDKRFFPYISFGEPFPTQLSRMEAWLGSDIFSPEMQARLKCERHGVLYCANRIEATYRQYLWRKSHQRGWQRAIVALFKHNAEVDQKDAPIASQ